MKTEKPVFAQIAEMIENDILSGTYKMKVCPKLHAIGARYNPIDRTGK
ncbi:hypothetical protein SAMN05878482_11730 [Peribacillus simplex]|uniref:Uncharacterized protein n=1 Tax=Peribacillus simplex TaxID=1478 RepID=A0A9X8WNK2_9BACI|nr:hypothetical protein [Peribacillus simplex]SIS13203.1 hypothetical protein SAMN05878482_11730 [Peribacillus simplex]